jgi:hypothetical protein
VKGLVECQACEQDRRDLMRPSAAESAR